MATHSHDTRERSAIVVRRGAEKLARLVGRKNRRTYMLGDQVEVEIQKVDALRHQIDLAVVLPEGYESEPADSYPQTQDQNQDQDQEDIDPFAPIAVLSEV